MKIALWIVQVVLALAFLASGLMKMMTPIESLAAQMSWIEHFPAIAVRLVGAAEFLGALGLILPSLLRIKPWLTPLAAILLDGLMAGAVGTHIMMGEAAMAGPAMGLGLLCLFVAWGRFKRLPITARSA